MKPSISNAIIDIENGVTQQASDVESCLHQMSSYDYFRQRQ